MIYQRMRHVLKDYVRREEIDMVAQNEGWTFRKEVTGSGKTPYQKHWATPDMEIGIVYCEDSRIHVRYIELRAVDLEAASARITSLLEVYNRYEIQGLVAMAQTPEQWIDALRKAAIAAPEAFDPEYFQMFQKGMRHPDAGVRKAAIEAAPYAKWRQFEEPLVQLTQDPEVGRHAELMLHAMRTYEWKKPA